MQQRPFKRDYFLPETVRFEKAVETDKQYPSSNKRSFLSQLEAAAKAMETPEFKNGMDVLVSKVDLIVNPKQAGRGGKGKS